MSLKDALEQWKASAQRVGRPVDEHRFVCPECEDSGWVLVDSGLDGEGRRVSSPTSRRCTNRVHEAASVKARRAVSERFN